MDPALTNHRNLTMADLIGFVEQDAELTATKRRNLTSSIRRFVEIVRGTLQMPASFSVLRNASRSVSPAAAGIGRSRWSNIRSDLKFILDRSDAPTRAPLRKDLVADWQILRTLVDHDFPTKLGLSNLFHWCSARGIQPNDVCDAVMELYREDLHTRSLRINPDRRHQRTCVLWNRAAAHYPQWPRQEVTVPKYRRTISFPWDSFPKPFRDDLDSYTVLMTGDDLMAENAPDRLRKPSTMAHQREQIRRFASALVHSGTPIEEITSLEVLVERRNFERGFRYYLDWLGSNRPSLFEIASTLVVVAKAYVGLDADDVKELMRLRDRLKCRKRGMTVKNRERLRPFLDPRNQARFLRLADRLIKEAKARGRTKKAALLVQIALAHEIEIAAPLRLGNLAALNLNRHFRFVGGCTRATVYISIPSDEVKNEEPLEHPLPDRAAELLDLYLRQYRSLLLDGPDEGWLFPGQGRGHKHEVTIRQQLCGAVFRHTGLTVNPHLYRHIAAFFYLQANPGDYETVRRLLGHKSVETTIMFYAEFERYPALRQYNDCILRRREELADRVDW